MHPPVLFLYRGPITFWEAKLESVKLSGDAYRKTKCEGTVSTSKEQGCVTG